MLHVPRSNLFYCMIQKNQKLFYMFGYLRFRCQRNHLYVSMSKSLYLYVYIYVSVSMSVSLYLCLYVYISPAAKTPNPKLLSILK